MQNTFVGSGKENAYQGLKERYATKASDTLNHAERLSEKYNRFSLVRLISFLAGVSLVAVLWVQWWPAGAAATVLFLFLFYRFVLWHQSIKRQEELNRRLHEINLAEVKAMDYDFSSFADGAGFARPEHPYDIDLDIFGPHSLYQSCNRTVSVLGARQLAHLMIQPASVEQIKARQQAVRELAPKIDWRQDFQALGMGTTDDEMHFQMLKAWIQDPLFFKGKKWLKAMLIIVPIWMTLGTVLSFTILPMEAIIFFLILPAIVLRNTLKKVNELHNRTGKAVDILEKYADLIKHVEEKEWEASLLKKMSAHFSKNGVIASKRIRRLAYIINQLNVRFNPFAILLNLYALWDLQWMQQLDQWKMKNGALLLTWFEGLQQIDALNSLAVLHANNPDWIFPQIQSEEKIHTLQMGHPLIHREKRVPNDLELPTDGHIKLVTGSNMGGKTTFLRTLGLNVVMATTGLPVCARTFALPPLWVYTSMRTQDSLHESTSSFFAELKRLKTIIEAVESHKNTQPPAPKILFLLDEILKGTNSADRHKGSKALLLQLIQSKGSGLVATHDLELGQLESQYPDSIENWCFEVDIEEGKLSFDYKLKRGVSKSFNATILMKEMGINIKN
jgi:hypothetical protein